MVQPAMLYGTETAVVAQGPKRKMTEADMRILRFSLGKIGLDKIRNETSRETIGVGELEGKLRETKSPWKGHLARRKKGMWARRF